MAKVIKCLDQKQGKGWAYYNGDCVEVSSAFPDNSVHFSVYSPPFAQLYCYSNSDRDMGNSRNIATFWEHYKFLIKDTMRAMMPGRLVAVHCMNLPAMKERDGYIGLKDFRGDLIRAFQAEGFIFHAEFCIWKDPLIEATRTKALGLMHKQLCKDSCMSRAGIPDYLLCFRKPGVNPVFVSHPEGLSEFAGENGPKEGVMSHEIWRRYASPVWMDIRQTYTLNVTQAREEKDEKHVCPLQLDVIERAVTLYSNPCETVWSPFGGVASEGFVAVKMGRKFIGTELKQSYWHQGCLNLQHAESAKEQDLI